MSFSRDEMSDAGTRILAPAEPLRAFVRHYWLGLHNTDRRFGVRPDGCVDVVFEVTGSAWRAWGFGSTTRVHDFACTVGAHYLGIRFQPGRARHFLDARTDALTDTQVDAHDVACFELEPVAERIGRGPLLAALDRALARRLEQAPPVDSDVDAMVREIDATHGALRMHALASRFDKSPRQLQRSFLQTVGVTAKFYATVVRAGRALDRITGTPDGAALADIAAEAGYADQSHMTRDFARLAGATPCTLARRFSSRPG